MLSLSCDDDVWHMDHRNRDIFIRKLAEVENNMCQNIHLDYTVYVGVLEILIETDIPLNGSKKVLNLAATAHHNGFSIPFNFPSRNKVLSDLSSQFCVDTI